MSRILRLAYLSPALVEAILDGKYPAHLTMKDLMEPFPMDWERQREHFFGTDEGTKEGTVFTASKNPNKTFGGPIGIV